MDGAKMCEIEELAKKPASRERPWDLREIMRTSRMRFFLGSHAPPPLL